MSYTIVEGRATLTMIANLHDKIDNNETSRTKITTN